MIMKMLRSFLFLLPLFTLLLVSGCSDSNPEAPPTGQAHPVNWLNQHPVDANADLASCQSCHDIDFKGSGLAVSCYSCHPSGPPFTVHPASWTVPVQDHQGFATQVSWTSCAVAACHGTQLQGGGAPSCLSTLFGTVTCHPGLSGAPPAPVSHTPGSFTDPVNHGVLAKANQIYCRNCHGRPENIFDGGFVADPLILNNPAGNCSTCHPAATAHPTNWQGSNDNGVGTDAQNDYSSSHRGVTNASCALCHRMTSPGSSPLPAAPSCFVVDHLNANNITSACHGPGGPTPHTLDGSYRFGSNHGPDAKGLTPGVFPNGMIDCQLCHGQPGGAGSNPQFNRGIISAGGQGCEGCHNDGTAHPSVSSIMTTPRESANWYDVGVRHNNVPVALYSQACALCHGANLNEGFPGSAGPACWGTGVCHVVSPVANPSGCVSCHALPPSGAGLAGSIRPNRSGEHGKGAHSSGISGTPRLTCAVCHGTSNGPGNANHFDLYSFVPSAVNNANVIMTGVGAGIVPFQAAENTTCTGVCHGKDHGSASDLGNAEKWY